MPLLVRLRGSKQTDYFVAGTEKNRLAPVIDVLMLHPTKSEDANPAPFWNWFKDNRQRRSIRCQPRDALLISQPSGKPGRLKPTL